MVILSLKHPGLFFVCEQCGALIGEVKDNDIYEENNVYCPVCHWKNQINYFKKYEGIVKDASKHNNG